MALPSDVRTFERPYETEGDPCKRCRRMARLPRVPNRLHRDDRPRRCQLIQHLYRYWMFSLPANKLPSFALYFQTVNVNSMNMSCKTKHALAPCSSRGTGFSMKLFLAVATVLVVANSAMAADDAANNAFRVCRMIDNTGLFTAACQVSSRKYAVTATIDLPVADARKACTQIVGVASSKGYHFPGGAWTVQIKSPTSGDKSIASCRLPK